MIARRKKSRRSGDQTGDMKRKFVLGVSKNGYKVKAFRKRTEGESKEGEWLVIRLEV